MALQYQLSTDEQIWVMIRVKQGLMPIEEALEYVRKQHEEAGLPPVVAPCHMYTSPRSPSTSPKATRAHSHNPCQQVGVISGLITVERKSSIYHGAIKQI